MVMGGPSCVDVCLISPFSGGVMEAGPVIWQARGVAITKGKEHGSETVTGAELLGLNTDMVVQELGWDEDVDQDLRDDIMDIIDADMVEEALEAVDVVILWWRDDDGDVVDGLVDAMPDLADDGYIWLLTPKVGRQGYIDAASVQEGVTIAGLSLTSTANVADDWLATKVVRPKGSRK